MGIEGLHKFLRDMCPHVIQPVELKDFAYKKCAVDTSLYIYKYMAVYGPDNWLSAFINFVVLFKTNHVHPCFVFDTGCPEEKLIERARRKSTRDKIDDKVSKLENDIIDYYSTGAFSDFLEEIYNSKCLENKRSPKRLLCIRKITNDDKIKKLEEELDRLSKQSIKVTEDDISNIKAFLKLVRIPYIDAELEAETTCVDLCHQGKVDFVISDDSDVFAYGCPLTIKDLGIDGTCLAVVYNDIINSLEMTEDTFLDFCIMCGCDYNSNIPLIGCKKAFSFMKKHGDIDAFIKSGECAKDTGILKHIRVRELFKNYTRSSSIVPYTEVINDEKIFQEISEFLFTKNIKYDIKKLRQSFS